MHPLDLPRAALARAGLDPATFVGAARLVADGRIRPVHPLALGRFVLDVARRGRRGPTDLVHLHALDTPFRPALVFGALRLDYRELDRRTTRLAHGFHRLGVRSGDRVCVQLHNGNEHVETTIALALLGAVTVEAGYRLKGKEIAYLLGDSKAKAIVFQHDHLSTIEEAIAEAGTVPRSSCVVARGEAPGMASWEALLEAGDADQPPATDGEARAGIMVYTSGTTGKPKGAARDLRDTGYGPILNFIADLPMRHDERHLVVCPLYHSAATFFSTITMALGGALVIHEKFEPEAVLRAIEHERISSMVLVPTMWNRLVALGPAAVHKYDLSSLRWAMSAAAPLPTDLARRVEELFGPVLYNFYGATESGLVTLAKPGEHTARPGTIGRVVRGTEIRLLDAAGHAVKDGEVGELWVRNRMLISGYFGNEAATAEASREGFFTVGDLARKDEDGFYYLADRKTDMVISGGINIYPLEIEDRLQAHPAVSECAVIGVPDADWGESLLAFVVLREGQRASAEELGAFVTRELADFKRPRRFEFVEALPRNPTGKVEKRELRRRASEAAPTAEAAARSR